MADYHRYRWEDIENGILKLAQDILVSDYQPSVVIGISKGGVILASLISDILNVPVDLMQLTHWGFGKAEGQVIIKHSPSLSINGHDVLLIDDVSDTGMTLMTARDELYRLGARNVRTAVLDYKALSSRYVPDYYAYKWTRWVYIIYPWESFEAYKNLNSIDARAVFTRHELVKMQELMRTK
jgi:hypoxanthine phosphoribosyltransferase